MSNSLPQPEYHNISGHYYVRFPTRKTRGGEVAGIFRKNLEEYWAERFLLMKSLRALPDFKENPAVLVIDHPGDCGLKSMHKEAPKDLLSGHHTHFWIVTPREDVQCEMMAAKGSSEDLLTDDGCDPEEDGQRSVEFSEGELGPSVLTPAHTTIFSNFLKLSSILPGVPIKEGLPEHAFEERTIHNFKALSKPDDTATSGVW